MTTRVLAVCLGNICRSPAAEAAIREAAREADVEVEVESAATGHWHVGEPYNPRIREAGNEAGLRIEGRSRQVRSGTDLDGWDVIVAMDRSNLEDLRRLAPGAVNRIHLFRAFDPEATSDEVPDPYYGDDDDYRAVIQIVRPAARGLIDAIKEGRV